MDVEPLFGKGPELLFQTDLRAAHARMMVSGKLHFFT